MRPTMKREDIEYAGKIASNESSRNAFMGMLAEEAPRLNELVKSLGIKYIDHSEANFRGKFFREHKTAIENSFLRNMIFVIAGLHALYDMKLPKLSKGLAEEMEAACDKPEDIMHYFENLFSFGEYSGLWMQAFMQSALDDRLSDYAVSCICASAEGFIVAQEMDSEFLETDDLDERMRTLSREITLVMEEAVEEYFKE